MLDEAKENYKELSYKQRALIMLLVGILPALYIYYEEGSGLLDKLQAAHQNNTAENKKYQIAKNKTEKLPLLEENFNKATEQLRKAQEKLPNKIYMDDILHSTASIAKETGIRFKSFKPGTERTQQGGYQYAETPIALDFTAKYSQVMTFFDNIVNMEKIIHLRNISLIAVRGGAGAGDGVLVDTKVELVVFRSS